MHVSAAHQGSEPVVNQEESNGNLPPCVHCQESDNGSLSSPRVVLDLMVLSRYRNYETLTWHQILIQYNSIEYI